MEAIILLIFIIVSVIIIDTLTYKAFNDLFKSISIDFSRFSNVFRKKRKFRY